ncbi:MAG: nucleotidyltransferase domain-containing protein [Lachnospiraceae bacterium]|nr:nucleotidyltransferase domain-containing protein [Lachnospiraceae bacterium]
MKYNIPERVFRDITSIAAKHEMSKVLLFGSRARGTHYERSDIDLAVQGEEFDSFAEDIRENVHSLLMFDIVNLDSVLSEDFKSEILRDGVILYEKA